MITKIMKQTNEALRLANHVAFTVIFFACVICPLEGRVCTRVRSETLVKEVKYPGECQQSFEANCGWFSFEKCIFNETVPCVKTRNMTLARYRIVEDCCPGYHRIRGGKCLLDSGSGESGSSSDYDDDDNFFLGISHGAYAGIICGILFVACVALLTAVHYRKRRLQEEKKSAVPADQDAAQRQQMISMEKLDSPPTVAT